MHAPAKVKLDVLLAGQPVGTWVVLDPGMSKILGAARTPEAAMRKAHVMPVTSTRAVGERPVMLQVPDPSAVCFF
jgi:hypothetical protein